MYRLTLQRSLLSPFLFQGAPLLRASQPLTTTTTRRASSTVAETSFWKSLIPKPLRKDTSHPNLKRQPLPQKQWNPATFFICIFLFIGSMSIQMIALRKDHEAFTRQSDARIGLLREVVEKLQNGEQVDVEKVLGTGDPEREKEWDEVLKEIEREEATRKKQAEAAAAAQVKADAEAAKKQSRPAPKSALSSQGFF